MELEISRVAALVGEDARARMLLALMDGRALPASELAFFARVSPQTASAHLSKLVKGKLLLVQADGKHRYYRLAGPKVASLIETLSTLATLPPSLVQTETAEMKSLRFARTCYTHLAGRVAVELNQAAQNRALWLPTRTKEYRLTKKGTCWLQDLGIGNSNHKKGFARACLDWTERRHHVAGMLGALLLERFFELGWMARVRNSRAIRLTHTGSIELNKALGLHLLSP